MQAINQENDFPIAGVRLEAREIRELVDLSGESFTRFLDSFEDMKKRGLIPHDLPWAGFILKAGFVN